MRTLELTDEQKKTLKLFSYYCGSHGAKTANLTVYLNDGGSIDWFDSHWYSETGTRIEMYDKISEFVNYILEETYILDYYDYDSSGSLELEIDVKERKLSITGYHREYSTHDTGNEWEIEDENETFNELFNELSGLQGRIDFNGSGDSGYLDDYIYTNDGHFRCPSFFEDWCYGKLSAEYGGWEINEGSQGTFYIEPETKTISLLFQQNIEDDVCDGLVAYAEF